MTPESLSHTPERREKLKEGFGVALCTKQKDESVVSLNAQMKQAETLSLSSVQFDFRHRTDEELAQAKEPLLAYRASHPDAAISIHGENPRIDEVNLGMKTAERTAQELQMMQELSAESYTIHPPSIGLRLFKSLPETTRNKIVENYCATFINSIKEAVKNGKLFTIAIENMPTKGENGAWGQSAEEILFLIKQIEEAVTQQGIDKETARKYLGATLDVNHAVHGAADSEYKTILENWCSTLGEYLKVIHVYAPSNTNEEFLAKYDLVLELATAHNPHARVFLESKQNETATKTAYEAAKGV